jgi:XTP/dITP diphosphohydrolase
MPGSKFENLMEIMYKLRRECPWDKKQTHDSLKANTLEEAYEVIETIDDKDYEALKGELGDLLLHIVFHSVIANENGNFTIDEVIEGIAEKLIRRHPHIFGDTKVSGADEIAKNWETIKMEEGRESVLEGVPKNLPQLYRAFRMQEKASKIGFDWKDKEPVWNKIQEEINELKEVQSGGNHERVEEEFGDLLFSLVNYARFIDVNPENALRRTNDKFIKRFNYIERKFKENGKEITKSTLEEMDKFWEESKKKI